MVNGVRRRLLNKLGRIQPVRIKHKKEWESTHTYDKKKRYWTVKEQILLTPYFYSTETSYDTKSTTKTNIKLSFRFVGKPGMMADFKRLTRSHVADYYAAGLNDNARIEEADLEEDDKAGDFQYLLNESPVTNVRTRELEAQLKRELL